MARRSAKELEKKKREIEKEKTKRMEECGEESYLQENKRNQLILNLSGMIRH